MAHPLSTKSIVVGDQYPYPVNGTMRTWTVVAWKPTAESTPHGKEKVVLAVKDHGPMRYQIWSVNSGNLWSSCRSYYRLNDALVSYRDRSE